LTKTITIERQRGFYAMARKLLIEVDGKTVAKIKQGQTIDLTLDTDATEICGRIDWGKTDSLPLAPIPDGARIVFKAYLSLNPLKQMGAGTAFPFDVNVQTDGSTPRQSLAKASLS